MKSDAGPRPTLGELHRTSRWWWLHCEKCQHYSPMAFAAVVIRWGAEASGDTPGAPSAGTEAQRSSMPVGVALILASYRSLSKVSRRGLTRVKLQTDPQVHRRTNARSDCMARLHLMRLGKLAATKEANINIFFVGMRVICVDDGGWREPNNLLNKPVRRSVYTIRHVGINREGEIGIMLHELVNPKGRTRWGNISEPGFYARRFRPATDISTGLSLVRLFEGPLLSSPVRQRTRRTTEPINR